MARLTRKALDKADFRFFIAQKERRISINRAGVPERYLLRNTNELLGVHNVDGGKTGQTARAGGCLMVTRARESIVWQEGTAPQDHPAPSHRGRARVRRTASARPRASSNAAQISTTNGWPPAIRANRKEQPL